MIIQRIELFEFLFDLLLNEFSSFYIMFYVDFFTIHIICNATLSFIYLFVFQSDIYIFRVYDIGEYFCNYNEIVYKM